MDRMALGIFIMLCSVLMGLSGGINISCKNKVAKGLGITICGAAVLGIFFFCFRLLLSFKISMMVSAFLSSLILGSICIAGHFFLTSHVANRFVRFLLRLLLTLLSLAAAMCAIQLMQDKLYILLVFGSILYAGALCLLAIPISLLHRAARRRQLLRSPVMQEVLNYCSSHPVEGVLLFKEGVLFFDRLPNAAYCKDETFTSFSLNAPPAHWKPYMNCEGCCYQIRFSDRAFPNMDSDQVGLAAQGLAGQMPGFQAVHHYATNTVDKGTHYDFDRHANVHTTETTVYVDDWFIFRKDTARTLAKQEKATQTAIQAIRDAAPKGNTWE